MKKVLTIILALFLAITFSCKTGKNVGENVFGTTSMMVLYNMDINQNQLDSICKVDTLPDYNKWLSARFTDYETNTVILKRIYLKKYSDDEEVIYILMGNKEPYKIVKRIAE